MRRVPFAVLCVLSGCSIPARDNPNDPAVAGDPPRAALTITNADPLRDAFGRPVEVGGARACDPNAVSEALTIFSRGRCIVFDASGSAPGEGETIESIRFDAWYEGEDDETFEEDPGAGTAARFAIAGIDVPIPGGWPVPTPVGGALPDRNELSFQVRVRITDSGGSEADAVADVILTNTAPVALAPPPLVLSPAGAAWSGYGSPLRVTLDGSRSTDPDDDPLQYCWHREDGSGATGCRPEQSPTWVDSPAFVTTALASSFTTVEFAVTDGTFASDPVVSTVQSRHHPGWGYEDQSGSAVQVDLLRQVRDIPEAVTQGPHAVNLEMNTGATVVAYQGDDPGTPEPDENVLAIYDTNALDEEMVVLPAGERIDFIVPYFCPFYSAPHPPDEGSTRFWVMTSGTAGTLAAVHLIDRPLAASAYTLAATWTPSAAIPVSGERYFHAVDTISRDGDRGDFWFVAEFGSVVQGLHYDGVSTLTSIGTVPVPSGYMPSALAFHEVYAPEPAGTKPELWMMWSRNVTVVGGTEVAYASVLPRGDEVGCAAPYDVTFDPDSFPEPPVVAWSLEFDSDRTAWTNLFTEGLARVRLRTEDDPCAVTLALETFVPGIDIGFDLQVESQFGQVSTIENSGPIVRAFPGGFHIRSETTRRARTMWPDSYEGSWIVFEPGQPGSPAMLMNTVGAGSDGVITRTHTLPAPVESARAVEYSTGSFWVGTILPPGVQRIDPTGAVADFIGSISEESADGSSVIVEDLGPPILVRSDPASGDLWVFATEDLFAGKGATIVYRIAPRAPRLAPKIAALAPGFAAPGSQPNAPNGYRIHAAEVQPSDDGSTLLAAAVDGASQLRLLRLDGDLQVLADVLVPDFAPDQDVLLARDLATNEAALFYLDGSDQLRLRRFPADLSSSTVVDLGQPSGREPLDVACLETWCFVSWGGQENGFARVNAADGLRVTTSPNLPSPPRNIAIVRESSTYYRVYVSGDFAATIVQALEFGFPFVPAGIPNERRILLVEP